MSIYLDNYSLHVFNACLFPFCSPYALRHWNASNFEGISTTLKIRHRALAIFEFIPVVGAVISLFELAFAKLRKDHQIVPITCSSPSNLPEGKTSTIEVSADEFKRIKNMNNGERHKFLTHKLSQKNIDPIEIDHLVIEKTGQKTADRIGKRASVAYNPLTGADQPSFTGSHGEII